MLQGAPLHEVPPQSTHPKKEKENNSSDWSELPQIPDVVSSKIDLSCFVHEPLEQQKEIQLVPLHKLCQRIQSIGSEIQRNNLEWRDCPESN